MELVAVIVICTIFGGLFLLSSKVAAMPSFEREAKGLTVMAHFFPISAIVLAIVAFIEIVYLQVKFSGLGIWVVSLIVGIFGLYFLNAGVSWLIAEHREEAWKKTLEAEEEERLNKFNGS